MFSFWCYYCIIILETTVEELLFIVPQGINRVKNCFELISSFFFNSLIISNGYTKTMHQLILVHSHLLDQCDREGVSIKGMNENALDYLTDVFIFFYLHHRILHFIWQWWITKLMLLLFYFHSTAKVICHLTQRHPVLKFFF